jgi:hypothetical protein
MEPDGNSGFLWGFADYKPYLMPFDVPRVSPDRRGS